MDAKHFFLCISEPLLVSKDDLEHFHIPIFCLSIPPSLHLKLFFNAILTDLKKVWSGLVPFLKAMHIPWEAYHGGAQGKVVLEGNQVI